MENTNKVERSELWNEIYNIVKQIPRKEVVGDAVDAPSATTSIENLINKYKIKAEKWDKLESKISKCYVDENGDELSEEDSEDMDLGTIGEIAASAFGWLQLAVNGSWLGAVANKNAQKFKLKTNYANTNQS